MKIPFTKMSGCGNDFILIDHRSLFLQNENLKELAEALCHRKNGIGADGMILIENVDRSQTTLEQSFAFQWQFFNADGSTPDMCGNGARCAAQYAQDLNMAESHFSFMTGIGPIQASVFKTSVKVQMFQPRDLKLDIPLREPNCLVDFINSGVPHAVLLGKDMMDKASNIRHHKVFPDGANVNFVEITLACGTGAIACSLIFAERKKVQSPVTVKMSGGILKVSFDEHYKNVFLEGPVVTTFKGEFLWKEF